ncbi:MAG: P-II family nitrogen regulator [Planctomycetota bacterium]
MHKIEAMIRHFKLDDVKHGLMTAGVQGMTVTEVKGYGRQHGHKEIYRGTEYDVDFVPKILIEVVVADDQLHAAIDAIIEGARTGEVGDGKIAVTPIEEAIRIRTADRGTVAL